MSEKIVFDSWTEWKQGQNDGRLANITKLINYYNGEQESYLTQYFKLKNLDDFPYYTTNITKRIIRKVAEVYKESPKRLLNHKPSDKYNELIQRKNARMKVIERMARLLGLVGVRPRVVDDRFEYDILRQFSAEFDESDPLVPVAIKYLISSEDDKKYYEYWTKDLHLVVDEANTPVPSTRFGWDDPENQYGVIPFVWCHSSEIIDDFFNTGEAADDLITSNEHINLTLSELAHKYRYVAFNPIYVTGNIDNVDDIKHGYNQAMVISDPDAKVGTLATEYDFTKDIEWIKTQIQIIEKMYGLSINWGMDGSTSGFQLVIENIDHLDDLKGFMEMCRTWERDIYAMEQVVAKADNLNCPNGDLVVDFSEVKMPLSQQEKNLKWQFEFDNKLAGRRDYWRKENPDITDEEIEQRENDIKDDVLKQQTEQTVTDLFKNG